MDSVHHIWCPLSSQEFQDQPDGAETTLTAFQSDTQSMIGAVGEANRKVFLFIFLIIM
ncbi:TPA_asm: hypothetical protein G3286_004833 [Salmonella enterica subsp. enterica serovar Newport]|nr:hypothetical protein [Salmonella enterica subsp. enterica serovar Newport]